MRQWLRENSLSLVFGALFLGALVGQAFAGWHQFNAEQFAEGMGTVASASTSPPPDFAVDVSENWQSEYLQFTLYIFFRVWLLHGVSRVQGAAQGGTGGRQGPEGRRARGAGLPRLGAARRLADLGLLDSLVLEMVTIFLARGWCSRWPAGPRSTRLAWGSCRTPSAGRHTSSTPTSGPGHCRTGSRSSLRSAPWWSSPSTYASADHESKPVGEPHVHRRRGLSQPRVVAPPMRVLLVSPRVVENLVSPAGDHGGPGDTPRRLNRGHLCASRDPGRTDPFEPRRRADRDQRRHGQVHRLALPQPWHRPRGSRAGRPARPHQGRAALRPQRRSRLHGVRRPHDPGRAAPLLPRLGMDGASTAARPGAPGLHLARAGRAGVANSGAPHAPREVAAPPRRPGLEEVVEALTADGCFAPTSLDRPIRRGREVLGHVLPDDGRDLDCVEVRIMLSPILEVLAERDLLVLRMRFIEQRTQQEIGDAVGLTQAQVSRRLTSILRQLRAELE